jgi:hypothetical protein
VEQRSSYPWSRKYRAVVSFTFWPLYHQKTAIGTQWVAGWVGPRADQYTVVVETETPAPVEIQTSVVQPVLTKVSRLLPYSSTKWLILKLSVKSPVEFCQIRVRLLNDYCQRKGIQFSGGARASTLHFHIGSGATKPPIPKYICATGFFLGGNDAKTWISIYCRDLDYMKLSPHAPWTYRRLEEVAQWGTS